MTSSLGDPTPTPGTTEYLVSVPPPSVSPSDAELPPAPRRATDRVVDAVGGTASAAVLSAASAWRHARSFHPRGRTFRARLRIAGAARFAGSVLGDAGEYGGVVRFSRGAGVPEPLPDMLGLALRLTDADGAGGLQDLLMLSSVPVVGGRNVIVPQTDYGTCFYSSIDRLGVAGHTTVLGARPVVTGSPGSLARLDDLATAIARGQVAFEVAVASPLGPWTPVGTLTPGDEVPGAESEALRFSPFHAAGGVEPVGAVNALRRLAYAGSQRGRAA